MIEIDAVIQNAHGIHCRPSAVILRELAGYEGDVSVRCANGSCNPRSMLSLMSLGLSMGTAITIRVEGPEEQQVAQKLKELFETHFDFPK